MGHGRGKSVGSYKAAPVPVADYNVTGDPTPDCKCNYFLAGTYGGKPYYRRDDGAYFIWWRIEGGIWYIGPTLGAQGPWTWYHTDENIEGIYYPEPPYTGNPVVASGPH